ncbi:MAG: tetratricopeptide repeat protein [Spirochaetes bacterium]|nr:tetratricopeptide repeat protein [Spirochaetota bacterium]MBU1079080.1 tetratricopeptide repeat protein [Spirochaetota bacterium]
MPRILAGLYERFGLNAYIQGDPAKALLWFRRLERLEPDSIRTLRNLGVILLAAGDAAGAEEYLLREERRYGESFHRHSALADIAYARGRREDAARRYEAALSDPEAAPAGARRGDRAFLEARLRICLDPGAFAAAAEGAERFKAAEAARDSGDPRAALALFEEAVALDPTHWPALNNAGSIALNDLGDPARALALFKRSFALARSAQVARNVELAGAALAESPARGRRPAATQERKTE